MRQDVEFQAEGPRLRGWLYTPDAGGRPFPTVVMAHGFSAVKEMYLDRFAEAFAEVGLAALVFDNRNFGASDGSPRYEIDPWTQVHDYRDAISYARTRPEVDRDQIGVWGSSYSGGHVLVLGAIDRRDQQPDLDRQQLDVEQVDLDVARDHDALVEHPLEHVRELRGAALTRLRKAADGGDVVAAHQRLPRPASDRL